MSRKATIQKYIKYPILILFYIGIWQLLSILVGSSLLLPSPLETGSRLLAIVRDPMSWVDIGNTFLRLFTGFLIGLAAGILLAILSANSKVIRFLLSPFRVLIKSTPVMSFVLILVVSVVSNWVPVVVSSIMVAPILWATTEQAILSLDPKLTEMSKLYFSPMRRIYSVSLPQMLPQMLASGVTALGYAWKAVITAEVLSLPRFAIGRQMYLCKIYLESADMIAWTILIVALSLVMEAVLKRITCGQGGKRRD